MINESMKKKKSHKSSCVNYYKIILNTYSAQMFMRGRPKPGPIGLFSFKRLVTKLLAASIEDDPYAEQILLKIYESSCQVRGQLEKLYQDSLTELNQTENIKVMPFVSSRARDYTIYSTSTYVIRATGLILFYDKIHCLLLSGMRLLLLNEEQTKQKLRQARRWIRRVMGLPLLWQYTGVTRGDIYHNTQVAQRATQKIEFSLNNAVLSGILHAPGLPQKGLAKGK